MSLADLVVDNKPDASTAFTRIFESLSTEDETDDDSAFENLLTRIRTPVCKPENRRCSFSSFLTDSSESSVAEVTDSAFYHRVDTSLHPATPCDRQTPFKKQREDSPESFVSSKATNTSITIVRKLSDHSLACTRPKSIPDSSNCSQISATTVRPNSASSFLKQPPVTEFVYSLYPLETTEGRHTKLIRHPSAERFVRNFKANRVELANRLFRIFNERVLNKILPDDMPITWNSRLLKTAGQCKYLRREVIPAAGEKTITRLAQIELSPKVCTTAERVRDTLLHEACHAAVWIADGVNDGHGPRWRRWANRAMQIWPDLPVVSVCHAYAIDTRFTYRCTGCGACANRHSKSIDMTKQVCGRCRSRFELLLNTPHGRMMRPSIAGRIDKRLLAHCPVQPPPAEVPNQPELLDSSEGDVLRRKPAFAEFVRGNYKQVRQRPEVKSHAEAMTQLGNLFKTMKIDKPQSDAGQPFTDSSV
ncbi:uncharacterized protein DEA37_0002034 [Paragonimus westermani]|uniref:SprT-like domain-containing protein n=1 Tax=Paragonimus westermani TaxID=34504 RepID=A0A5J4NGW6_9TREM|nr:uncharacterized protein DEA37_0002034 [Paragonimus westermani]